MGLGGGWLGVCVGGGGGGGVKEREGGVDVWEGRGGGMYVCVGERMTGITKI